LSKTQKIFLIALAICTALSIVFIFLHAHFSAAAHQTANIAATASKGNHGVAEHYANYVAREEITTRMWMVIFFMLTGSMMTLALVEFAVLPLLSLNRVGALCRVTYYEGLLQPFTLVAFVIGLAAIVVTTFIPFDTFGEDTTMYRDIAISFVSMFVLIITVFVTAKVIDEEIENRTMLTLMSKPLARWQVIIGKYLGIVCLVFVASAVLMMFAAGCGWLRYFSDQRIDLFVASIQGRQQLFWDNDRAILLMIPAFLLEFLEMCTLAAISTAIATRYSLAVNMTGIIILYIVANLTRFIPAIHATGALAAALNGVSYLLPYLSNFDINQCLVYRRVSMPGHYIADAPTWGQIWEYVGTAVIYGVMYIGAALSAAIALFRNRELI
jgi:ABC-type transport system involved in multi-copper enzyme maturation permease subunit